MTDQDSAERDDTTVPEGSRPERRNHGRKPARSSGLAWLRESVIILVSALLLSLVVKTFLVQAFFIPSESMHETLIEGDRVLVSKLRPGPFDLRRGDIVVFKDPGGWLSGATTPQPTEARRVLNEALTFVGLLPQDAGEHLIKRIIGLPGDHVACEGDGAPVTVNGVPLDEPYLAPGAVPSISAFDITVPEGTLWLMGDNRGASADSRANMGSPGGPYMPVENVVGTAFVTVWPFDRAGTLTNPSDTFADVPDPA
ncbi:signal peptidase I [Cellulomonas sp. 179-A 4D5 NHS]|uniref:signal peptidase I n=1 Tax=Cellulomonas sp. 179-A 4D5 NHS TaxID=3142378 RepID=UPI0039A0A023